MRQDKQLNFERKEVEDLWICLREIWLIHKFFLILNFESSDWIKTKRATKTNLGGFQSFISIPSKRAFTSSLFPTTPQPFNEIHGINVKDYLQSLYHVIPQLNI